VATGTGGATLSDPQAAHMQPAHTQATTLRTSLDPSMEASPAQAGKC
jgi:hypothetical protein